ncbi:ABC transporter substrate-binding protein [Segnochrobactrum spirostomi]|uniref:Extracellular solute-binding protein n=1 Tax=Segnochrobactrum spirostomi TaxID=2608987 RepID=A0A6A7Y629_9HYPH|nr:extracellular solute-binding protein [Segnochrobactrum spirostomi]MQT14723.1 extracellular solute-binding protein [Segnochrobactrum spirostomi]
MKRSSLVVALATASVLALSTAPGLARDAVVADPDAKVDYNGTLSVLTKFGLQQLSPYFVNVAKAYEALHPGVKIELIQESDDSIKGKTKTLVASNSLPDVYFSWTGSWGENFVRGHRAVDLSKVIGPDTPWGKTISPAAVKAFEYNGKLYGIPLYLDAKFMGYSKPLFDKAGIAVPKTFEELLASCDALKKSGTTAIALGNKEAWPALHYIGQLVAYNVPTATLERDFDPAKATFDDPGYVAALDQFKQLADRCTDGAAVNGTSYASALQSLSNGDSAMYYQEIIEFDQSAAADTKLKRDEFGFFRLPPPAGAKGDVKAIEGAPEGYMISAASRNIPLAIDFMKFVTSPANAKVLSAPPYGQPSATIGGASPSDMNPAVVEGLKDIAEADYLMPWLDTANTPRVAAAWLSSIQALLGGTMTADQVMASVKKASAADAKRK